MLKTFKHAGKSLKHTDKQPRFPMSAGLGFGFGSGLCLAFPDHVGSAYLRREGPLPMWIKGI